MFKLIYILQIMKQKTTKKGKEKAQLKDMIVIVNGLDFNVNLV